MIIIKTIYSKEYTIINVILIQFKQRSVTISKKNIWDIKFFLLNFSIAFTSFDFNLTIDIEFHLKMNNIVAKHPHHCHGTEKVESSLNIHFCIPSCLIIHRVYWLKWNLSWKNENINLHTNCCNHNCGD